MSETVVSGNAASRNAAYSMFRSDLRVFAPQSDDPDRRYTVYDPVSDLSYYLGSSELFIARIFDGSRTPADVSAWLLSQRRHVPEEKLVAFERRLRQLGLLSVPGGRAARVRDPATGISYGPLKAALSITVLRFQPEKLLDVIFGQGAWLCSRAFVLGGLALILVALACVMSNVDAFVGDVIRVYAHGWHWMLWHYPVIVVSIAVHELGHALACRLYKVRITDFGIAIYLLLATGWARPLQRDWSALPRRARLITIVMGPYASLLFVALGVAVWRWASEDSVAHTLGIVMAVSASAAVVPTLLPFFNGDTYLAITEYFGVPRLRQRAFRYVHDQLRRRPGGERPTRKCRTLYWAVAFGSAVGWGAAWAWVASSVIRLLRAVS
jgi:putative peptide zinc metalloprotease protein